MTVQVDPEGNETRFLRRYAAFGDSPGARVLEVGCGDGRLTWRYAASTLHILGIDHNHDDLRLALADRPASLARRAHFAEADAERLPVPANAFDLAIFAWSF